MKKLLTLLLLLTGFLFLKSDQAHAQFPTVQLQWAGDSTWIGHCSVADSIEFMYYGIAAGYPSNDSVNLAINFGDGVDTSFYLPIIQGQIIWGYIFHTYALPGAYTAQFIMTGSNGSSDTLTDPVLVATTCAEIEGRVYRDSNSDCIFNSGDQGVQTLVKATYNGNIISVTQSDSAGNYFLTVPAGFAYVVSLQNTNFTVSCPVAGQHTVSVTPATNVDFSLQCNAQSDLTGNISAVGFRTNANTTIGIYAQNQMLSCVNPNATVTLTLDPLLSYVSSTIAPISTTANTVVFNAGQLSALTGHQFATSITLLTSITANVGDTLCVTMTIDPITGDADPADNTIVACLPVRNSWDPNEKHEAHVGTTSGTVAPGTKLDYTIMFQNLGNDDAYEIDILDEIDSNLDLNTLTVTGMSHAGTMYLIGNTVKFEFNNINLPAASVNEPLSHGWITYSISPKPGLALGTAVNNTAGIYFDFNPPVITNTVTNIFDLSTVGIAEVKSVNNLNVYPNPANDYFTVNANVGPDARITIYDLSGRVALDSQSVSGQEKINIRGLQPGFYEIVLSDAGKISTAKLTIK